MGHLTESKERSLHSENIKIVETETSGFRRLSQRLSMYGNFPDLELTIPEQEPIRIRMGLAQVNLFSKSHPLITLSVTNAILGAIADSVAQAILMCKAHGNSHMASFDYCRLIRFSGYQAAFAPICYKWHVLLDTIFPIQKTEQDEETLPIVNNNSHSNSVYNTSTNVSAESIPKNKLTSINHSNIKRLLADQIVFAPIGLMIFFVCITLLEGGGWDAVADKLSSSFFEALFTNWKLWPLVQFVNFAYVPLFFRLPVVSAVGIFWNAYLSWLNN